MGNSRLVAAACASAAAGRDEVADQDEREDRDDDADRNDREPPSGPVCWCLLHIWSYAISPPPDPGRVERHTQMPHYDRRMTPRILILGAGFGGLELATILSEELATRSTSW